MQLFIIMSPSVLSYSTSWQQTPPACSFSVCDREMLVTVCVSVVSVWVMRE